MQQQTFADLGLSSDTLAALEKKGYETPTPIQAGVIPLLLNGEKDIIGQAQTGTGKTAAFALPLLEMVSFEKQEIQAIVMTPTRELAIQVASEIRSFTNAADRSVQVIYGGNSMRDEIRGIKSRPAIIVGTPGRIQHHIRTNVLKLGTIQYFVLDEADEMLNFGFRKEIESILALTAPQRRVLLFSATMPKSILEIAQKHMGDYDSVRIAAKEMTNENITQKCFCVKKEQKIEVLARIMAAESHFYAIIFCRTKRETDKVAAELRSRHLQVEAIHGDIDQKARQNILARFKSGMTKILVATDVAARGIDVSELNFVINYSIPESYETYTHRIGRTGRAGNTGTAITFVQYNELQKLRFFERNLKTTFEKGELPDAQIIIEKKIMNLSTDIDHTVNTADLTHLTPVAEKLLSENKPEQVIAALLYTAHGNDFDPSMYTALPEVVADRSSRTGSRSRSGSRGGSRRYSSSRSSLMPKKNNARSKGIKNGRRGKDAYKK